MGGNMDYRKFLNDIYTQFKSNNQYTSNEYVKFFKENNTNIVNFEVNDINKGIIQGTLVDQSNFVLIYFYIKNEVDDYIILSRTNISKENIAIITNALITKGKIVKIENIRRNFDQRMNLYKCNYNDQIINGILVDSEFTDLVSNIIEQYSKKNKQKRHNI